MKKKKASSAKGRGRSSPRALPTEAKGSNLNLMVQINDPKNVRKDLLEALREIIIFMQGYEAFRKIQEEKVAVFSQLRDDVKALNNLVDYKLRRVLPKGKLAGLVKRPAPRMELEVVEKEEMEPMPVARAQPKAAPRPEPVQDDSGLDELESQLRDIESRLKRM